MAVFTKDRSFYKSLFLLAIPISLQNLITYGVNFADNVMIGSLGDNAISGVYVGGQLQQVLQMFVAGMRAPSSSWPPSTGAKRTRGASARWCPWG